METIAIYSPIAVVKSSENPSAAESFVDFVLSPEGQAAIGTTGWEPVRDGAGGPAPEGPQVKPDWARPFGKQDELLTDYRAVFGGRSAVTSPGRVVAPAAVAGSATRARRWPDAVVLARLATAALAAILIALPVARLAGVALESGVATLVATVLSPPVLSAIVASAWTSGAVAVLAVVLGTAAALVTERLGVPGRSGCASGSSRRCSCRRS